MTSICSRGFRLLAATVLAAAALPAAASAAAAPVSVKLRTIPNAAKFKNATISMAPAPAGKPADWALLTPRRTVSSGKSGKALEPIRLLSLGLGGLTAAVATNRTMFIPAADYPAELLHDGGTDWVWDGSLVSVSAQGSVLNTGVVYGGVGFVTGPSGTIYTTDDGGLTYRCDAGSSANCEVISSLQAYRYDAIGGPDALAVAGGHAWGVLKTPPAAGLLEFPNTPGDPTFGPFVRGKLEGDPGDALIGDGNYLYAAGVSSTQAGRYNAIYRIAADALSSGPKVYTSRSGMPANASVKGMTVGPGGNIFFEDAGTNKIGVLNLASSRIREIALPSGYSLPGPGNSTTNTIAPGPSGANVLFVAVHNKAGVPAVAELRFGS